MKIAIGCDHIVTDVKNKLKDSLIEKGHQVLDVGTYDFIRTHYPIFGQKVAEAVVNDKYDYGIAICGTGVGISNSAQKVKGARVALVRDLSSARISRKQFDANIIAFGGRITGLGIIEEAVDIFINEKFSGDQKVVEFLDKIVKENKDVSFAKELADWEKGKYHD
ncbi:/ lacB / Galactose-6-phosphate isomerase subunit lacB /:568559 Reverse [Candidatus Hepatoplasma crinochetorum]|uniref:/ lacB / Galactose-6-phosphate isomerase subunit lacB /:568559 Reverse n=1 Tax=Candidatus Hepatoplasma crinochetorum TaxID=295596 RepID=A0A0G7ZN38_9MOLU|nr:/ lacB / Galactose-6-phosphate isomerase subunit lacB /:568559 Reverse [Candidatus Hepatoplasma crinochetorum]